MGATIVVLLFPFLLLGFITEVLCQIFILASISIFIISAIIFLILKKKEFFSKYKHGWKLALSKILNILLILEMLASTICFFICLYIKNCF